MAYEVTKLVNGRPYRYRVQSERDAETGKTRNRWTYLGRADAHRTPAAAKPRANARAALLDALERLLDRSDPSDVTAAAVSVEAGLAHGTFYRYFSNRNDAINALKERLRDERAAEIALLDEPAADAAAAHSALRTWVRAILSARAHHFGLVRALYALAAQDPDMRAALRERRDTYTQRLAKWLRDLADRGITPLTTPETTAVALFAMLDGVGREALAAGEPLDESQVTAVVDLLERAVFGRLS